jgi:hypothetical protein
MDNRVSTTEQHHRKPDPQKEKGHFRLGFCCTVSETLAAGDLFRALRETRLVPRRDLPTNLVVKLAAHAALHGGRAFASLHHPPARYEGRHGGVAERLKAHAWRACMGATPSRVRIPLPPPTDRFGKIAPVPPTCQEHASGPVLRLEYGGCCGG